MKIDVFLKLRKDSTTGTVVPFAVGVVPMNQDASSDRFVFAQIKFEVEVDEALFDPVIYTGAVLQAARVPVDKEAVVRGLRKVKTEMQELDAS